MIGRLPQRALDGAVKLLRDCLGCTRRHQVVIVCDETTVTCAAVIAKAAARVGVSATQISVQTEVQERCSRGGSLPGELTEAVDAADAVISCVANIPSATRFRVELVGFATTGGRKVGHMPGANLSILASAVNIDYTFARQRCDDLAVALYLGKCAELTTFELGEKGRVLKEHVLRLELGGPSRTPITSTGILMSGTWGNIPGGETFIAPLEGVTGGTFVLNGAMKGRPFGPREQLVLSFEDGALVRPIRGPQVLRRELLRLLAEGADDRRTRQVAELGIGVNEGVRKLVGNPLLDEKAARTAHIALGDSTRYGGKNYAPIHEDLVTRRPSLVIDGRQILDKGRFAFRSEEWRESIGSATEVFEAPRGNPLVSRGASLGIRGRHGELLAKHAVVAGRFCEYTVGDLHSSAIIRRVYSQVPDLPCKERLENLLARLRRSGVTRETAVQALCILERHNLVAWRED